MPYNYLYIGHETVYNVWYGQQPDRHHHNQYTGNKPNPELKSEGSIMTSIGRNLLSPNGLQINPPKIYN